MKNLIALLAATTVIAATQTPTLANAADASLAAAASANFAVAPIVQTANIDADAAGSLDANIILVGRRGGGRSFNGGGRRFGGGQHNFGRQFNGGGRQFNRGFGRGSQRAQFGKFGKGGKFGNCKAAWCGKGGKWKFKKHFRHYGYGYVSHGPSCHWMKNKWQYTGSYYWKKQYYLCRGWW